MQSNEAKYVIDLGRRIRELREVQNSTQRAVAKRAGVARYIVSRLETGDYASPGLRTLLRVSEGLGLPLSNLMPDAPFSPTCTREGLARARLAGYARRLHHKDLELIIEMLAAVVNRSGPH